MAYYLRKEKKKKGIYLQMYESHWDKEKKQPRSNSVMAFGYVDDLISDEIPDPIAYYSDFVAKKNEERAAAFAEDTRPRAFAAPVEYNLGHRHPGSSDALSVQHIQHDRPTHLCQGYLSVLKSQNGFEGFPSSLQQLSHLGRSGL